jgi:hypothetical protein
MDSSETAPLFGDGGWVQRKELWQWLATRGCAPAQRLPRDNFSDGQYHWQWKHTSGQTFDLNANLWDAKTFQPLIDWAISCSAA